jgi:hypothetical protein
VVAHWAALNPRSAVTATGQRGSWSQEVPCTAPQGDSAPFVPDPLPPVRFDSGGEQVVPLVRLCLARSGDKGDTANVGVAARSPQAYSWLLDHLTEDVVRQHFKGFVSGAVERHPLPNLSAVNFLLHGSLGGGGTSSLRFDAQGKTYAQYLLSMEVTVPASVLASVSP